MCKNSMRIMYEFCINCARTLCNVDKDLLDLLTYASICWSASTSTYCIYLCLLIFALSLLYGIAVVLLGYCPLDCCGIAVGFL